MYASFSLFITFQRFRRKCNTQYGWLVRPCPTRTFTLLDNASLSWRTVSKFSIKCEKRHQMPTYSRRQTVATVSHYTTLIPRIRLKNRFLPPFYFCAFYDVNSVFCNIIQNLPHAKMSEVVNFLPQNCLQFQAKPHTEIKNQEKILNN